MVLATYLANYLLLFFFIARYIEQNRCFVREAGKNYNEHVGLEFTYTFLEKILCHVHWMFFSWVAVFVFGAVVMTMYLKKLDAQPIKIMFFFIALILIFLMISSMMIAADGHSRLVGGGGV